MSRAWRTPHPTAEGTSSDSRSESESDSSLEVCGIVLKQSTSSDGESTSVEN